MIIEGKILNIKIVWIGNYLLFYWFCLLACFEFMFSNENHLVPVSIAVNNIAENRGELYIAVYSTKESYKQEKPDYSFIGAGEEESLVWETFLPEGRYLVAVFQDLNGNKKLDTKLFGIPKEPVALTGWDGKGIPKGWEEQSFNIKAGNPVDIILNLVFY